MSFWYFYSEEFKLNLSLNLFWQELDPPKAVDLETTAKIKVPSIITQPNLNNDQVTVRTGKKTANSCDTLRIYTLATLENDRRSDGV